MTHFKKRSPEATTSAGERMPVTERAAKQRAAIVTFSAALIELISERRRYCELCWHLGGAQGDIDWDARLITYFHRKTHSAALIRFGTDVERILRQLPLTGPLFPSLRDVRASDRATEFKQRCNGLGIAGVTLHSYRYAWAERAKTAGYPERFAQEALGHNSKAVHRAYARHAEVTLPALEEYERDSQSRKVVRVAFRASTPADATTAESPSPVAEGGAETA